MKVSFKCEKCGNNILEEVLFGVEKFSSINDIEMTDNRYVAIFYGNSNDEGGDIDRYQCASCGEQIGVSSPEELFDYLKNNNMLE